MGWSLQTFTINQRNIVYSSSSISEQKIVSQEQVIYLFLFFSFAFCISSGSEMEVNILFLLQLCPGTTTEMKARENPQSCMYTYTVNRATEKEREEAESSLLICWAVIRAVPLGKYCLVGIFITVFLLMWYLFGLTREALSWVVGGKSQPGPEKWAQKCLVHPGWCVERHEAMGNVLEVHVRPSVLINIWKE